MRRYEALLGPIDDNATKAKGSQDHAKAKEGLKAESVTVPGLRGGTVDDWNLVEMKKLLHWIFLLSFPNNLRKLYNKSLIKKKGWRNQQPALNTIKIRSHLFST